jgi:hypothetical protein
MNESPDPLITPVRQRSLWKRLTDSRGSFFLLSLLFHVLVIGVAAYLVVQVVQGREKLKFTAPPPSSNPANPVEHQVKMAKKNASMSAPTVSKRITSTAANASISLPPVEMNASSSDMISSTMSALGSSLGAGASPGSGGGGGLAGLTAFGFRGGGEGLKGTLFDLKQTSGRSPSEIAPGPEGTGAHTSLMEQFFRSGWDESILKKYYRAGNTLIASQVFIPLMSADEAPKAFEVQNQVKPSHWLILYRGAILSPKTASYRFHGIGDDLLAVRIKINDHWENVFADGWDPKYAGESMKSSLGSAGKDGPSMTLSQTPERIGRGKWFQLEPKVSYPIEVLVSEFGGGKFRGLLMIEERDPPVPYPKRSDAPDFPAYPVFQLKRGMPIPPYQRGTEAPDVAPMDTLIFRTK